MRAALVSVCVVASVLIALLIDGGRSSWSTRPFSSDYGVLSGIFLLLAAFVFLRGCRNPEWDAFSPVRFYYTLWFILLTLGCLRLTTVDLPFTWRFWVTVAAGLVGFYLGARLTIWGQKGRPWCALRELRFRLDPNWQASRALMVVAAIFVVGALAFAYEYWRAGMLPLFAEDPNWARFNFAESSYINRFAVTLHLVMFLGYVGVVHLRRYRAAFLIMGMLAFGAITLMTARVFILSAVWMALVFFHYGRRRLSPRLVLLVALVAYPLAKMAVDVKRFYNNPSYSKVLDQIDFPEKWRIFSVDYLSFTLTLQTFDNLTSIVPNEIHYSHGWYIGYPVRVLWTPRQSEGFRGRLDDLFWERSADWSPFPAVTTTYMGWPYADFGIPGVFVFSWVFGWLSSRLYARLREQPSFWRAFLYAEISFAIALSIYSSYLSLFDVYWNLAVIGIIDHVASGRSKRADEVAGQQVALSY